MARRNRGGEIRCQFLILKSAGGNPVSVRGGKSGVGEIQCQFLILARKGGKSGVSSSFLPGKMNRHRISRGASWSRNVTGRPTDVTAEVTVHAPA